MLFLKPDVIHGLSSARFLYSLTKGKDLLYALVRLIGFWSGPSFVNGFILHFIFPDN